MAAVPLPAIALASSADTIYLASGSSLHAHSVSASSSSSLPTVDPPTAKSHTTSLVRYIAVSRDGAHVATISEDKLLRVSSTNPLKLLSSRTVTKKCSDLSFDHNGDILVSDRVGDVYRYTLTPREVPEESRRSTTELATDPSRNPEADLVLGHVSIVTAHLLSQDGRHIITADRDEHIRVSRYPQSYVIERFLHSSDGFVSALHIPEGRPEVLISAGGENSMRIWNWQTGEQLGSVQIWQAVMPHRKARSAMRKLKNSRKRAKLDEPEGEGGFYDAPEGWMLPAGQGVCVKKIRSVQVGDQTVVMFHSEGASALHSFILDTSGESTIRTLDLTSPVLDFTDLPSRPGQFLVSLDRAWGVLRENQAADQKSKLDKNISAEQAQELGRSLAVVQVGADGTLTDVTASEPTLLEPLYAHLNNPTHSLPAPVVGSLQLYPNLSLLPRWIGFEEDEEDAGITEGGPSGASAAASDAGTAEVANKQWTKEELEKLGPRQLGRLKAAGVDVGKLLKQKKRPQKKKFKKNAGPEDKEGVNGEAVEGDAAPAAVPDDEEMSANI